MSMQIDYLRVVLSLALCLGLGVGAIFLMRSRFRGLNVRNTRDLALLESLQIDARTAVHVLRYKDERLLLTTHDGAIQVTALRSEEAPASAESAAPLEGAVLAAHAADASDGATAP